MTAIAERDEVGQVVGLPVVLNSKQTKWPNVVHIQGASCLAFLNTAELTNMTVSVASRTRLSNPVRPVVWRMSPAPRGVVCAIPVHGLPSAKALSVTKGHLALVPSPVWTCDGCAAVVARACFNAFPSWMFFCDRSPHVRLSHAVARTILTCPAFQPVGGAAVKLLTALVTRDVAAFARITAFVRSVAAFIHRQYPFPSALLGLFRVFVRHVVTPFTSSGPILVEYAGNGSEGTGIGSEGVVALQKRRRFVGVELKERYAQFAMKHLTQAEREAGAATLWDRSDLSTTDATIDTASEPTTAEEVTA